VLGKAVTVDEITLRSTPRRTNKSYRGVLDTPSHWCQPTSWQPSSCIFSAEDTLTDGTLVIDPGW